MYFQSRKACVQKIKMYFRRTKVCILNVYFILGRYIFTIRKNTSVLRKYSFVCWTHAFALWKYIFALWTCSLRNWTYNSVLWGWIYSCALKVNFCILKLQVDFCIRNIYLLLWENGSGAANCLESCRFQACVAVRFGPGVGHTMGQKQMRNWKSWMIFAERKQPRESTEADVKWNNVCMSTSNRESRINCMLFVDGPFGWQPTC